MVDRRQLTATRGMSTRKNLVIEGLKGASESEILTEFLDITAQLEVLVYKVDVEEIFRMKRRDLNATTPGPVMIKLNRVSLRDRIMQKKANLRYSLTKKGRVYQP